ncbi:multidrug effflux MFS transporter [Paenirhodobacter populi]|nr:multidrug effflux MFS transporter [Sinirhodobacter populi]
MTPPTYPPEAKRLPLPEFVALLAFMMALVAFSIDAMLPSLPVIARELSPQDVNRAQLVLTIFMMGMGLGTFFAGPVSDAIGRKSTLAGGLAIYVVGALLAVWSKSLEMLLLARFIQGIGASAGRIVSMALIRDLYAGSDMAKITSFVMMFFILIPAIAPTIGGLLALQFGWRGVFGAFVVFGIVLVSWMGLRQPETLPDARRRPLIPAQLLAGAREVLSNRDVVLYTLVIALGFGQMFALLSSAPQLFAAFGVTDTFPYWFGFGAILAGSASAFNARFVMRLGMHRISRAAYLMQMVVSAGMLALLLLGHIVGPGWFWLIFLWNVSVFFMAGVTFGNLNAMAMQKMGHLAGMAASVIAAISTIGAVVIAAPVGLMFRGTPMPLVVAALICSTIAWWILGRTTQPGEE